MPTSYPTLGLPAILFAHRGARAHAPENTVEAFQLALRLGATGIESDVWRTEDGRVVLDHDGVVGSILRRRGVGEVQRDELPAHIPELSDLYRECGTAFALSLDVKDPAAFAGVLEAARAARAAVSLWLCHPDLEQLVEWKQRCSPARLVHSTRVTTLERGTEHHASQLRELGVDAVNLHHSEWSAGTVAMYHRFGRYCFGWDAQQPRIITALLNMGVDGIYSDHVDRMVDAFAALD